MKSIHQHVDELFDQIPDSDRKETLKQEIIQNLQEKVSDLMAQGKEEEDAVNKVIVEFGDIDDICEEFCTASLPVDKRNAGLALGYSLWGSGLIIALLVFVNLYLTPRFLWCVFPVFGVLWWPLTMFFRWRGLNWRNLK